LKHEFTLSFYRNNSETVEFVDIKQFNSGLKRVWSAILIQHNSKLGFVYELIANQSA